MTLNQCKSKLKSALLSEKFTQLHSVLQIVTMLSWMLLLMDTDSDYSIYFFMGIIALFCRKTINQDKKSIFYRAERLNLIISSLFSVLIIAANYGMFTTMMMKLYSRLSIHAVVMDKISLSQFLSYKYLLFTICLPVLFLGGMYVAFFILQVVNKKVAKFSLAQYSYQLKPRTVFLSVFLILTFVYSVVMIAGFYPGFFSPDSVDQVSQILTNKYHNHHPFFHTMTIRVFVLAGLKLFGDINIGVAFYSLFSIILVSVSFSYSVVTLCQLNLNKKIIIAVFLSYLLLPHYITYSFYITKDVPFAVFVLLFTVSLFRSIKKIGANQVLNHSIVAMSGLGTCLFRSNGLIAFVIVFIVFALFFGKENRKMTAVMACVILSAFILKHPVLKMFDIPQPDIVESLSIPLQQIARTVKDNDDLTHDQIALISKIADYRAIPERYTPVLSDPIKGLIRESNNIKYLADHKLDYARLYIQLGIKHPKSYLLAWIDQTRGYWNGGYNCPRFCYAKTENDFGLNRTVFVKGVDKLVFGYCTLFEVISFLQPFLGVGLYTWLFLLIMYIGYCKKNKLTLFLTVPCIAIILSLLIATPVFAELRYAYALFCCLPFLSVVAFVKNDTNAKKGEE